MADYTKSTGSAGTMMIRDTGTYVEFYLRVNNTTTYNNSLDWRFTVNGVTQNRVFDFNAGSSYKLLGRWLVTYDQTVNFYLYDSNTSGLGGPTSFSQFINRTSHPDPPGRPTFSQIGSTSVMVSFKDGANNGAAITSRRLRWGTSPTNLPNIVHSDGSTLVTGLQPGTTYYFDAQAYNSKGWSAWGPDGSVTTYRVPPAPYISLSEITQSSVKVVLKNNGDGGTPVVEWQIGYGTNPNSPQLTKSGWNMVIGSLAPGLTYYFWGRGRNAVGWGEWSAKRSATLRAGVRYKHRGVWVTAVAYVKVDGVWKPTIPMVKIAGLWKETG